MDNKTEKRQVIIEQMAKEMEKQVQQQLQQFKKQVRKAVMLAFCVAEFDEFYKKYKNKIRDSIIIEKFLANYTDIKDELYPFLQESVWLKNTLSFQPMPEDMSQRVWTKIKNKIDEMKQMQSNGEKEISMFKRPVLGKGVYALVEPSYDIDKPISLNIRQKLLVLLLHKGGKRKFTEEKIYITGIIKHPYREEDEEYICVFSKNLESFDRETYNDLRNLTKYRLIEKMEIRKNRTLHKEKDTAVFFELDDTNTEYRLTEKGVKFAEALARNVDNIDKNIMKSIEEALVKNNEFPLLKLFKYIYEKYPQFQDNSIDWQRIEQLTSKK